MLKWSILSSIVMLGACESSAVQDIEDEYILCIEDTSRDGMQIDMRDIDESFACFESAKQKCVEQGFTPVCFE